MGLGKTYSTKYLADSNNNTGAAGQVLSTTSTGIDWADANTLPGAGLWLEIGNDIYNSNTGNVGIGTASPSFGTGGGLQITNATQANLRFTDTSASTFITDLALSNDDFYIINRASSGQLKFRVNASNEAMTIDSNGNVGIGTTSPSKKLEITGSTPTAGDTTLHLKVPTGNITAGVTEMGNILFSSSDASSGGTGSIAKISTIAGAGTSAWIGSGRPTDLAFFTQPLGTSATLVEAMRIDQDGKVGIGTTSPSQKLEVSTSNYNVSKFVGNTDDGTGYVGAVVEIESNNDARGRGVYLTHRLSTDTTDSEWYAGVPYTGDGYSIGNAAYGTSINSDTGPAHKDQSKLFILENGNVGIGTVGPGVKLDVVGDVYLRQTTFTNIVRPYSTQQLTLLGGGANTLFVNGNVGIGTTSPAYKLDVEGSANNADIGIRINNTFDDNLATSNPTSVLWLNAASNNGYLRVHGAPANTAAKHQIDLGSTAGSSFLTFSPGGAEKMRITTLGGISFGSTGTAYGSSGQVLTSAGDASPTWTTPTTGTVTGSGSATQVAFWDGESSLTGSQNLYWDSTNSHLGIGDTTPGSRLKVTSGTSETSIYTVDINHVRNDANVSTMAMRLNVDLSGADTTTADRTNYGLFVDTDSSANGDATHEHRIRGVGSFVNFTGFTDVAQGGHFLAESNYLLGKTAQLVGVYAQAAHDTSSTDGGVSNMYGVFGTSSIQDLGDVDNAFGGYFSVSISTNRGNANVGVTKGVEGHIDIDKANTITYGEMMAVSGIIDNNEGTVPTFGNQYLFKGDYQGTKGGNAYGIYCEGDKHYFDGNVGIGTTSPGYPFSLESATTGLISRIYNTNADGQGLLIRAGATTSATRVFQAASSDDTKIMTVNSNGNVGIGTTSPSTRLEVSASATTSVDIAHFSNSNGSAKIKHSLDGVGSGQISIFDASNNEDIRLSTQSDSWFNAGNVGIGTVDPSSLLSLGNAVDAQKLLLYDNSDFNKYGFGIQSNEFRQFYPSNSFLSIGTISTVDGSTYAERMRIDSNGNVGIGTTSPSNKLEVVGSNAVRIHDGTDQGSIFFRGDRDDVYIKESNYQLLFGAPSGMVFELDTNLNDNDVFNVMHRGSSRMYINGASGNVGIGVTSPIGKLNVSKDSTTDGLSQAITVSSSSVSTKRMNLGYVPGSNYAFIDVINYAISNTNQALSLQPNGGNVGIGTTSPIAPLHITGPAPIATQPVIKVERTSPVVDYQDTNPTNGYLFFTERFSNLAGSVISTRKVMQNPGGEGVYTNFNHGLLTGQGTEHNQRNNSFHWKIDNSTNEVLTINTSGNVGIGTTNPNAKLNVNGGIKIEGTNSLSFGGTVSIPAWGINSSGNDLIINDQATTVGDVLLTNAGNVGIGTTSPSYKLDVSGNGRFTSTVTAANFILSSDERLKENIEKACDNRIKADWKTFELKTDKGQKRYGVIAQELEKTNPEFVREDTQGFKSVAYIDLLIAKIAELEARLEKAGI
ncbi:tail fiber domain-containing protein [bacterium]|nr:tail fiber domain-containing protein [bacterium]